MVTLTVDAIAVLSELLGIQTLPLVLDVGPRHDSVASWRAAQQQTTAALRASELIDSFGDVAPGLAAALHILALPDREIAARQYTASGIQRVCVARRGDQHAYAARAGDTFEIATFWSGSDIADLVRPLLHALGSRPPARVSSFSLPTEDLEDHLDRAGGGSGDYTQALRRSGLDERTAVEFGVALARCLARAEIVGYAYADGVTYRAPGAVVVHDSAQGRIVAGPSLSSDGRMWSTFTAGSDHRIVHSIAAMIELLPGHGWDS
ncbi:ESX secretion-associated protein EspG [Nocardia flavorosea]|uniref:ESX secretion-associated protein EspG n=1 Tax=Nocardia flavorosea TaxID=53429 RepID=A0A846YLG7_9NOCA|nr:ESX secretion-associated protein EspG [Nocardia flavorosea]NKY58342.1 ESX secretion-associated protein EspG [Nocardia flavorosea]